MKKLDSTRLSSHLISSHLISHLPHLKWDDVSTVVSYFILALLLDTTVMLNEHPLCFKGLILLVCLYVKRNKELLGKAIIIFLYLFNIYSMFNFSLLLVVWVNGYTELSIDLSQYWLTRHDTTPVYLVGSFIQLDSTRHPLGLFVRPFVVVIIIRLYCIILLSPSP